MSGIEAISAISGSAEISSLTSMANTGAGGGVESKPEVGFGEMLADGLKSVEKKIDVANAKVREFAVNEDMPVHEVIMAMGEARLSVELALQVRTRLVEGYREIMNMQL